MLGHTPRDLLLNGAVPLEARKNWARLPKGRGCAALSLWPVGPLSRTGPLPVEHFPAASKGRFASTLAGCTRKPHTLLLRLGEKRFGEVFSQGRWPRAWGPVRGSTRTGQVRSTCKSLFMHPAHSGCSSKREGVRQLLGSPSSTARVERGRADLGAQWACCFPCCPVGAETKRSWPSTRFSPLTSDRGPWPLGCCSVERAPFSTSTPNRNQLRPRPRGKALAGRSLGRGPVMTAHTHGSLSLHGAVPLGARKIWARFAKCRGCAVLCRWPVGPLSRTGPLPLEDLPSCFQRPVCKQPCLLFPQAAHSPPKSGRKALWGGPLSGSLGLSAGTS